MAEEKRYTKKQVLDIVSIVLEGFVDAMEQAIEKVVLDVKEGMDQVEQEMLE